MAFDYTKTLATALRSVEKFGRPITFVRISETLDDPTKPWLGTSDARTSPTATQTANAVFVHPESLRSLGYDKRTSEFIGRSEQIAITSFGGPLDQFTEIIDSDGSRWHINQLDTLKPGPLEVLHFAFVKR